LRAQSLRRSAKNF